MPRSPRLLLPRSYYHVMTRGNNKNQVFKCDSDYDYYLALIKKYKQDLPFDLYHYCLMPNHIHLLVKTKSADSFSLFMKKLNLAYFHYYRKHYGWVGHFWQGRFKSQPVGKDEYFIQCGKYIELNPIRANLVDNPEDYPYSSYRFYASGKSDSLLTEDFIYQDLVKEPEQRQKIYKKLVVGEEVEKSYKNKEWGSDNQRYNEAKKITYHLGKKRKFTNHEVV